MEDIREEFIIYLEMSKRLIETIKQCVEEEEYIDAAYRLGQLHSALDFKYDQLQVQREEDGRENKEDTENE